jgi:hypothetical protein
VERAAKAGVLGAGRAAGAEAWWERVGRFGFGFGLEEGGVEVVASGEGMVVVVEMEDSEGWRLKICSSSSCAVEEAEEVEEVLEKALELRSEEEEEGWLRWESEEEEGREMIESARCGLVDARVSAPRDGECWDGVEEEGRWARSLVVVEG